MADRLEKLEDRIDTLEGWIGKLSSKIASCERRIRELKEQKTFWQKLLKK